MRIHIDMRKWRCKMLTTFLIYWQGRYSSSHRPVIRQTDVPARQLKLRRRRKTWVRIGMWISCSRQAEDKSARDNLHGLSNLSRHRELGSIPWQSASLRTKVSLILVLVAGCTIHTIHLCESSTVSLLQTAFWLAQVRNRRLTWKLNSAVFL